MIRHLLSLALAACGLLLSLAAQPEPDASAFVYVDKEPEILNFPEVVRSIGYPEAAAKAGVEGNVIMRVLVDANGGYVRHEVVRGLHPALEAAVAEHLPDLRFRPASLEGKPLMYWMNIPFSFRLVGEREQEIRKLIQELSRQLESEPDNFELWHKLGVQRSELSQWKESLEAFDKSLAANPRKNKKKDPKPYAYLFYTHYSRAAVYSAQEQYAQAIAEYSQAIQYVAEMKGSDSSVQATLPGAYIERGYLHEFDSAYALARQDYNQALALDPGRKCEVYGLLADLAILQDDPAELVRCYEVLIACKPDDDLLRYSLGFYRSRNGDYARAVSDLDSAALRTKNAPLRLAALNRKAWCQLQLGELAQAEASVQAVLNANALNPLAYYYRGQIRERQQRRDEACADLRRALTFGLEGDEGQEAIAFMRQHCGGWEE